MNNQKPTVIAIIPARSGSKGLPHKNIKKMNGKPLMVWSIEQAINCTMIDDVVVSTDSTHYAQIACNAGAMVPFLRPDILSNDTAQSFDVIEHTIEFFRKDAVKHDIIILLEPTSPLRNASDIELGLEKIFNKRYMSVVSMCEVKSSHPSFMFTSDNQKRLNPYLKGNSIMSRRQDVETLYYLDGNIYASWIDHYMREKTFCGSDTTFITTPELRSFEIDDANDFDLVELIHKTTIKK